MKNSTVKLNFNIPNAAFLISLTPILPTLTTDHNIKLIINFINNLLTNFLRTTTTIIKSLKILFSFLHDRFFDSLCEFPCFIIIVSQFINKSIFSNNKINYQLKKPF